MTKNRIVIPSSYTLMKTELLGKTLYQWRGNDSKGYSPKYADPVKAAKYPSQNKLKNEPQYDV